ncbi:MAG: PKD domain-containing protein [Candidatus Bipolaricaulota bacterium]|nr:PKD domain-containing protein [Candidatus Bipolaricaulota bacterium]
MKKSVVGGLAVLLLGLGGCGPAVPPGEGPVALCIYSPVQGEAPLQVTFDGTLSTPPGSQITSLRWDFGDGASATGAVVSHWYREEGTYSARLTVTDAQGRTGTTVVPVIVGISYPLDVLEWRVEEIYFGTKVSGRVRNIGDRRINEGRVAVRFYDKDWNLVRERSKILGDLAPGQEQIFEITTDLRPVEIGGTPHHAIYTEVIHTDHPLSGLGGL